MATPRHILFPYDFSDQGRQTARFAKAFASRFRARITLYSVVPPTFERLPADMPPVSRTGDDADEWRAQLQARLDKTLVDELAGVPVERVADGGDPGIRIADFAQTHDVDLIMMPTHGLGLFRSLLVGSATTKVLDEAKCPIWTAAHVEMQTAPDIPHTILCALDGGDETAAVARYAADFAAAAGATLHLLHVVSPITDWPALASERRLQEQVREQAETALQSTLQSTGVQAPFRTVVGSISPTVVEEARRQEADLVVTGRGSVAKAFGRLRSHEFGIIEHSPCPVLSV